MDKLDLHKYRGVTCVEKTRRWKAQIKINGKNIYLGCFSSEGLAAKAYNEALDKYGLDRKRNSVSANLNTRQLCISSRNKSGYRGVYYNKKLQRWISRIHVNRQSLYLGSFKTPKLAVQAYNQAALKYRGPNARINILP